MVSTYKPPPPGPCREDQVLALDDPPVCRPAGEFMAVESWSFRSTAETCDSGTVFTEISRRRATCL